MKKVYWGAMTTLLLLISMLATTETWAADDPSLVGKWSEVYQYPVIPIHASVIPEGNILAWDSYTDDLPTGADSDYQPSTQVMLLNPVTGAYQRVDSYTDSNLFCSGHAHTPDGNLFAAGGNISGGQGIRATNFFDRTTRQWHSGPDMIDPRWYPSVTALANGEMLITSGRASIPEILSTKGELRELLGAALDLPLYPWLQPALNGRVLLAGPDRPLRYLDTSGDGSWQTLFARDGIYRDYGSHAMYHVDSNVARILVAGGGKSSRSAVTVSLSSTGKVTVKPTGNMNIGRRQFNLLVLPGGRVLATGGNSSGASFVDEAHGVYKAELWNPKTGKWTLLAAEKVTRQYHGVLALTQDGRGWSAGGGFCGPCNPITYHNKNGQFFQPPYLFKKDGSGALAPRPKITSASGFVQYGANFTVSSPGAASVGQVDAIRLSSVTHSVNFTQRRIPLPFNVSGEGTLTVTVTAPANSNLAPPGYYFLFILNKEGVPSVARAIRFG